MFDSLNIINDTCLLAFEFVDLVILGCHISQESIQITKEVFLKLRPLLHIEPQIAKNCTPFEAKVCLEKNVAKFCVLLADAATVNDAYANLKDRKREYEDLLQTAASRVGEMVFVCSYYYYFDDDYDNDINNNSNNNINNNSRYGDDENNNNNNSKIVIKTGGTINDHWVRITTYRWLFLKMTE